MNGKILIADALHEHFKNKAIALGYEVEDSPNITFEEVLASIESYVGLAVRTKFKISRQLIEAGKNLQFIARAGAGLDNIDVEAAANAKIALLNAPEGNMDALAEHALGMLLAVMNNFVKGDHGIRNGKWDREANRGYELAGKTVGIIGYGFMGKSFARKLSGLGVKILAYDKYKTKFSDQYVEESSMEQIVKQVDVLSLHIPLTQETRQLIDDEYLFHFKKPIFLINTARGEILNTQALLRTIEQGKILGAGLDVLETEKFPALAEAPWYEKLRACNNVLLTPHVAGWTFDSYEKISKVLAEKLEKWKIFR